MPAQRVLLLAELCCVLRGRELGPLPKLGAFLLSFPPPIIAFLLWPRPNAPGSPPQHTLAWPQSRLRVRLPPVSPPSGPDPHFPSHAKGSVVSLGSTIGFDLGSAESCPVFFVPASPAPFTIGSGLWRRRLSVSCCLAQVHEARGAVLPRGGGLRQRWAGRPETVRPHPPAAA